MQDTIQRMSAAMSLLVNPLTDTIWLVGTRWALFDVYSHWQNTYGDKLGRLVRACIEDDQPIWPERFTPEVLALKRKTYDSEYRWSCLMMNNPRNSELQDLNINDLMFWEWSADGSECILYNRDGTVKRIVDRELLDVTCTVDLAAAEKIRSDRNAITTVGVTPWNEAIVLESWAKRSTAMEVIDHLFEVKEKFHPRAFGIEDVGYQKVLKTFVRQFMNEKGIYLNIIPLPAKGKKEFRIRSLQPYMATSRLFVKGDQLILRNEMSEFPLGEHDDAVESLSMHTMLWRGQMAPAVREKYKESEEKLIKRIRQNNLTIVPSRAHPSKWSENDENLDQDEFDWPRSPIFDVVA